MKKEIEEVPILKICNIVISTKIPIKNKLSEKQISNLMHDGWKITNEEKSSMLIKKIGDASICMNLFGNILMQSLKSKEDGKIALNEIMLQLKKAKVL